MESQYDVVVVGGGPAGLSAATLLARSRRKVLVIDAGNPRNASSHGLHNYLTREGILPPQFLAICREQVKQYKVEIVEGTVMQVLREGNGFIACTLTGERIACRRILLATGVVDHVPEIPGFKEAYGKSVHHCPYCDGWEHSDEPIAVYGNGTKSANMALSMLTWSKDVVLCTDGPARISEEDKKRLVLHSIRVYEQKLKQVEQCDGKVSALVFSDGSTIRRTAVFFNTGCSQRSSLPEDLGCNLNDKGAVEVNSEQCSSEPGIYVVGDASFDAQFVVIAAAEGAKAGMSINQELQKEDLDRTTPAA